MSLSSRLTISRTSIGEEGRTPCFECHRCGQECNLPPSRRGGDYSRYRKRRRQEESLGGDLTVATESPQCIVRTTLGEETVLTERNTHSPASIPEDLDDDPIHAEELRNPSDALQILARTTSHQRDEGHNHNLRDSDLHAANNGLAYYATPTNGTDYNCISDPSLQSVIKPKRGIEDYKLVAQGLVNSAVIQRLIHL